VPTVIATQALREATNADAYITPAQEILRATVEVIAGVREAELAAGAVAQTFPELTGRPCCRRCRRWLDGDHRHGRQARELASY
jgi:hypothetical protein